MYVKKNMNMTFDFDMMKVKWNATMIFNFDITSGKGI